MTDKPILIGEQPLAKDANGRLIANMGSVFLGNEFYPPAVVVGMGPHRRLHGLLEDSIQTYRREHGLEPLDHAQTTAVRDRLVELVIQEDSVLIRPDIDHFDHMHMADEMLQTLMGPGSQRDIKFLYVHSPIVREGIKREGKLWRLAAEPVTDEEMMALKVALSDRRMYFYNRLLGTRQLTYSEFASLGTLPDNDLLKYLREIHYLLFTSINGNKEGVNAKGYPELEFFRAGDFRPEVLRQVASTDFTAEKARAVYDEIRREFHDAVAANGAEYLRDDVHNPTWRTMMLERISNGALKEENRTATISSAEDREFGPEFDKKIRWRPGATLLYPLGEDQSQPHIFFDNAYDHSEVLPARPTLENICDLHIREIIKHFVRQYERVKYINVGVVVDPDSLSAHGSKSGIRELYAVLLKSNGDANERKFFIRIQKYNSWFYMDEGKDVNAALREASHYHINVMDRYDGAALLGVTVPPIRTGLLTSYYYGKRRELHGQEIQLHFFQREMSPGIPADKIPASMFQNPEFCLRFYVEMAKQAVCNMIVGRVDENGLPIFDAGHEVVELDPETKLPRRIRIISFVGFFRDYLTPDLAVFAPAYAKPIASRTEYLHNVKECADIYVCAAMDHFKRIKGILEANEPKYRSEFQERPNTSHDFRDRWNKCIDRLARADYERIGNAIYSQLRHLF